MYMYQHMPYHDTMLADSSCLSTYTSKSIYNVFLPLYVYKKSLPEYSKNLL